MAVRNIQVFINDITGETIEGSDVVQIEFMVNGKLYHIDTDQEGADGFQAALAQYVSVASEIKGKAPARQVTRTVLNPSTKAVRIWAKSHGVEVNERGRIPASVYEAFHAAGMS